jgi:hypothetical protein
VNAEQYVEEFQKSQRGDIVYLAGPIDYSVENPDDRHDALAVLLDTRNVDIWCPFCVQTVLRSAPAQAVSRNIAAMQDAGYFIAVWNGPLEQPSFGTPVEIFASASGNADRTVVVGTMGSGLLADALRARGVREVLSLEAAVSLLRL